LVSILIPVPSGFVSRSAELWCTIAPSEIQKPAKVNEVEVAIRSSYLGNNLIKNEDLILEVVEIELLSLSFLVVLDVSRYMVET